MILRLLRWLRRPVGGDSRSIGHYRITGTLGAGGMGVVYAAVDERLGRSVAVKMISDKSRDGQARERLWREARAAARVNHPNVCQVHEVGEQAGEPYVVMELLEGESLAERLARGALPLEEAVRFTLELLQGLGALHRNGLLHRDLKPSNVFLTPHGVKLLDFGLVRRDGLSGLTEAGAEPSLTATGMLVGTPRYMAPEQVEGRDLDGRSDLFAVGAILYEMLSGRAAFSGRTPVEVLHGILHGAPVPIEGPASVVAAYRVAERALAKRPEGRPASADAMTQALRAAVVAASAGDEPTELQPCVADGRLTAAREALARRSWSEAFKLMSEAEASRASLTAEDLEGLGEAAIWTNRPQEAIDARQRAFAAYMRASQPRRAALVALGLVVNYHQRHNDSVAAGWLSKARRLLEPEPEGAEHGHLGVMEAMFLCAKGDFEACLARAREARQCGERHASVDVQALALSVEGLVLTRMGETSQGMALLDEAMTSSLGGELGPLATALTYCQTLGACLNLFDYRRALEWTRAVERVSAGSQPGSFSGDCRVHHVSLLKVRGEWARAAEEASATSETELFCLSHAALATYEVGEIRLREGDLGPAESAFLRAHELGLVPQPGLALLRLAEGKVEEGAAAIAEALGGAGGDRLRRAHLLPAQVEIALAASDLKTARAAAAELAAIADVYGTTALCAAAACACGAVAAAEARPDAVEQLRRGHRLWLEAEVPYDAACARLTLSQALLAQGNPAGATLEADAARSQFERLGARPDAQRAVELLRTIATPGTA